MEIDELANQLKAHEHKDDLREEKTKQSDKEATKMAQPVNVFTNPSGGGESGMAALAPMAAIAALGGRNDHGMSSMLPAAMMASHGGLGGGLGAGLGAGLVGGLLGGLLFGGRGPWGGFGGGGVVDNTLAVSRDTAQIAFDTVALQTLNGIAAAIPAQAGSVKDAVLSAIQGLSSDVASGFATQTTNSLQQTILLTQQASALQAATQAAINAVNMNVSEQGSRGRETTVADGAATRALLTNRWQLEDATEINKLNAQVIELREEGRHRELGGKIEIQNTAIAAQQQGQQQQQQQQLVATVNSLFPLLQGVLQVAHATNSNVIAGNTAAVTTGIQTASPTNVNAP